MAKISDPVIQEYDEKLKEIFHQTETMPTIECAKRIASWNATFLTQYIEAKAELGKAEIKLDHARADEYKELRWKNNVEYTGKEALAAVVLSEKVENLMYEVSMYDTRVEFFREALKAINNHTWTLTGLVKFYASNREELFS